MSTKNIIITKQSFAKDFNKTSKLFTILVVIILYALITKKSALIKSKLLAKDFCNLVLRES